MNVLPAQGESAGACLLVKTAAAADPDVLDATSHRHPLPTHPDDGRSREFEWRVEWEDLLTDMGVQVDREAASIAGMHSEHGGDSAAATLVSARFAGGMQRIAGVEDIDLPRHEVVVDGAVALSDWTRP